MIGGAQGSGVDSSANIFAGACALAGLWIYGIREYYSSIKGPHSYFEMRVSGERVRSHVDNIDILVTFDTETLIRHSDSVSQNGGIMYDSKLVNTEISKIETIEEPAIERIKARLQSEGYQADTNGILEEARRRGIHIFPVPYDELISKTAQRIGETQLSKVTRIVNVLAVAGSFAILGLDENYLKQSIMRTFSEKKKIIDMNVTGAGLVYDFIRNNFHETFPYQLRSIPNQQRLLLMGNEAVALGKIVGGCRVQTYYPITPASDESEFLESHEIFNLRSQPEATSGASGKDAGSILVTQTEDEIAAITMATGAALTGTRSATSTSGPGFSLMVEGLGWAGINEVPVVITLYSRGGPSTGMPTRHEQGDLKFVLNASHGEFPRIVLCSGDLEECFYDAIRIFNYAERFQMPAIHLIDKGFANSSMTILPLRADLIPLDRGKLLTSGDDGSGKQTQEPVGVYKRFAYTEDGISPRATLGMKGFTFWNSGDEHNEIGHIEEDPFNRIKMMTKRMTKLDTAAREIPDEEKVNFFESKTKKSDPDVTIVSWGSTKGSVLDGIKLLEKVGIGVEFLQIRLVSPFPTEIVKEKLSKARLVIDVEQNYSGQMAQVIAEKTLIGIKHRIVKFNGRQVSQDEIYHAVKQILANPEENERIVLTHGA